MALERVPADIRASGGIARMADPELVSRIMDAVNIPVMAKVRIGHFMEARILEELGIDFIDESEVLTPADERYHIDKHAFKVPFVCGARNLGEALRRISEGAAMLRTKGEPGTGNVVEAVRHIRQVMEELRRVINAPDDELAVLAKEMKASLGLLRQVKENGCLPVLKLRCRWYRHPCRRCLNDAAGRRWDLLSVRASLSPKIRRPGPRPSSRRRHIYDDPAVLLKVSRGLGEAMRGLEIASLSEAQRMQERGD